MSFSENKIQLGRNLRLSYLLVVSHAAALWLVFMGKSGGTTYIRNRCVGGRLVLQRTAA